LTRRAALGSHPPRMSTPDDPRPRAFNDSVEFIASRSTLEPCPEVAFAFSARGAADGSLECERVRVDEGLDALYEAVVEVCTADPVLDVDALLGERCALEVIRGPRRRRVCGVVRRAERLESAGGRRRARLHVVPALWALTQRTDCRIFQGKTAIEVAEEGARGRWAPRRLRRVAAHAGVPPSGVLRAAPGDGPRLRVAALRGGGGVVLVQARGGGGGRSCWPTLRPTPSARRSTASPSPSRRRSRRSRTSR
jgi:hypothetical protein